MHNEKLAMQSLRRARILAFCLDALVCALAADAAGLLAGSLLWYGMPDARGWVPVVWWVCGAAGVLAFLLRDASGGRARRWLALRVEDEAGRPPGPIGSIARNLPLLIPLWNLIEVWPVFRRGDGQRPADRKAGRRVVVND
jgi:hypothetical protein